MAPFPAPTEMVWHECEAPDPCVEGHMIVVWSPGYRGDAVVQHGMWLDDKCLPRWGAGKPGGPETRWCQHPNDWRGINRWSTG